MPESNLHLKKYEDCKALLGEKVLDISNDEYRDWSTVLMFYASMHLVENKLTTIDKHFESHKDRNEYVRNKWAIEPIKKIRIEFKSLYDLSKVARYTGFVTFEQASEAFADMLEIENVLLKTN